MPNPSSAKGNPAAKRMQNVNLKARRAASWAKRQRQKLKNIALAKERFEANEAYRKRGEPTPYEQRRAEQRAAYEARKALLTEAANSPTVYRERSRREA